VGSYCGFLILAERLNTHRLGVINLPLCLKGAYWGGLAAVWKIDRWKCVGKGHGWIRREMEWLRGLWNGTTEPPMLCGAEVGEMNWTQCSEGWTRSEVRTATPETKWEERMNLPQAHGNKTRSIFWYCNNYWVAGNSWGFRAAERGKGVDFVRLLYIIRLYLALLICHQARARI